MTDVSVPPDSPLANDDVRQEKLEDAGAALCLSDTLLAAADHFVDQIRGWVMPSGAGPCEPLFEEALHAQGMIAEARRRVLQAKKLVNETEKELLNDRRSAREPIA